MVRLAIVDQDGKSLSIKDVSTATELLDLAEQARRMIRDCEQLARQLAAKSGSSGAPQMPYLS